MKASTHDGRFHADEIFALAVLNIFAKYYWTGILNGVLDRLGIMETDSII